ncbi:MAG TPA: hypothetical protein ENJ18_06090, partial [Nannocystis exedens]|nr:hypothetical protein [Nannocystis exedens]
MNMRIHNSTQFNDFAIRQLSHALLLSTVVALGACGDDSTASTSETSTATDSTSATGTNTNSTNTATSNTSSGSDTGTASDSSASQTSEPTTSDTNGSTTQNLTTGETDSTGSTTTDATTTGTTTGMTTGGGCGICNQPNQKCIDDVCVTSCQGQDPDPCGPDQICDVISGECKDPDATCSLGGGSEACGDKFCGPGSVCDGLGECVAIAPCAGVDCTDEGSCWGSFCSCTREIGCDDPSTELLNGPFSSQIGGLDFADDCTAWMVTLRSGTDYVRKLTPEGMLTEFAGVANLNMGEVRILKRLTMPQSTLPPGDQLANEAVEPLPVEGFGEVAITYTCCPTCGCFVDPPQGVARLDEENMMNPLPIIIAAKATQGVGPFGNTAADAGPQGLTWGENRVLYVGNSTDNGDLNTADLDKMTQEKLTTFDSRVTAAAPVSPAHILVGLIGGEIFRYNTNTGDSELLIDLMADITSISHDSFSGLVYVSLSTLEVVELHPFTGEVSTFEQMPGKGRVAVSPSGNLWFTPVKYVQNGTLSKWTLPDSF